MSTDDGSKFPPTDIRRTGKAAFRLDGWAVAAEASSKTPIRGLLRNRWHEITIWTSPVVGPDGERSHCVAIRYRSEWGGEPPHDSAHICPRSMVADTLTRHDVLGALRGYPDGAAYVDRQAALRRALIAGYDGIVSDVLRDIDLTDTTATETE